MTHQLTLSDDRYQAVVEMAAARQQTPDELLAELVDEAWERACAPYDAAFQNDPDWQASAREAAARANEPQSAVYSSTAELFQALGASPHDIEEARRLEDGNDDSLADNGR
ncbi:MAG TPA: hypothetical protein VFU60_00600 [Ktedonobacterales bacterium]|nr:hypothetical protein [Ktedonobacterales bacterium]